MHPRQKVSVSDTLFPQISFLASDVEWKRVNASIDEDINLLGTTRTILPCILKVTWTCFTRTFLHVFSTSLTAVPATSYLSRVIYVLFSTYFPRRLLPCLKRILRYVLSTCLLSRVNYVFPTTYLTRVSFPCSKRCWWGYNFLMFATSPCYDQFSNENQSLFASKWRMICVLIAQPCKTLQF